MMQIDERYTQRMAYILLILIYISFVSLGLPDSLLGSAWPVMHGSLGVPLSYASYVSMLMSVGTVISSLLSHRLTKRFGTGKVTAFSVALTAVSLFGYSVSSSYVMLLVLAVPNGLGAGGIDAALNNYVALNYPSRHMSWLHCMWGVGTVTGPYVMGFALTRGIPWTFGYRVIALMQICLAAVLIMTLPIWDVKKDGGAVAEDADGKALSLREVFRIPGSVQMIVTFFCYCALEITPIVWSGSYLAYVSGFSAEQAASLSGMFFIGITLGRAVNGFLTYKISDRGLIRMGIVLIGAGIALLLLPFGKYMALVGLLMTGLGCAPIYPSIIHSTPEYFGRENTAALIGVQMASAYTGFCLMPPVFGVLADAFGISIFPVAMVILLVLLFVNHEVLVKQAKRGFGSEK